MSLRLSADGAFSFSLKAGTRQWRLLEGAGGEPAASVDRSPFVIGRAKDCQLVLPESHALDKTTSRWHCFILRDGDGYVLNDGSWHVLPETGRRKPSISGTLLNGSKVQASALREGDLLAVGPWRLKVSGVGGASIDLDPFLRLLGGAPSRSVRRAELSPPPEELLARVRSGSDEAGRLDAVLDYALAGIRPAVVAAILEARPDGSAGVLRSRHREYGSRCDVRLSPGLLMGLPGRRAILSDSCLLAPLPGPEGPAAFLYLDDRGGGGRFTEADLRMAEVLAETASSLRRQAGRRP